MKGCPFCSAGRLDTVEKGVGVGVGVVAGGKERTQRGDRWGRKKGGARKKTVNWKE